MSGSWVAPEALDNGRGTLKECSCISPIGASFVDVVVDSGKYGTGTGSLARVVTAKVYGGET